MAGMKRSARLIAGVLFSLALGGCASVIVPQSVDLRENPPQGIEQKVELTKVPFFPQQEYQCGPAALATVLAHRQVAVTPDDLVPQVYVPDRQGSLQVEMLAAARRHGMVSYTLGPKTEDLLREVAAGNPVLVLQDHGIGPFHKWHYAVVTGYDLEKEELILRSGDKQRQVLSIAQNEFVWGKSDYWAMVVLSPERIPATATETRWLAALAAFERVDSKRARAGYSAFLERWPDNVNAMIGLANTYHAAGDLKQAEAILRRAQQRQPDSVVVLNNLAQTLVDQGRSAEALPIAERAVNAGGPFADTARETRDAIRARQAVQR
jgi:hypothetical protein